MIHMYILNTFMHASWSNIEQQVSMKYFCNSVRVLTNAKLQHSHRVTAAHLSCFHLRCDHFGMDAPIMEIV